MEDLLRYQIHESCRLALPEGLKELMSDISREVLRAQPNDLCKFIADYLSTLLITRENLSIAARVCDDVWDCCCYPELDDELQDIGLDEEDINKAKEIIEKFFNKGQINEKKIVIELVKKANLSEEKLPEVLDAIRKAFLQHQKNRTQIYESSSNSDDDDTTKAVKHTLKVYRKTKPSNKTYNIMARKIQASYRAYRARVNREKEDSDQFQSTTEKQMAKKVHSVISKVTFGPEVQPEKSNGKEDPQIEESPAIPKNISFGRLSSTSLAGSYMSLPAYTPYSAHDFKSLSDLQEMPEKEQTNFDYTPHQNQKTDRENKQINNNADERSIESSYEDTKGVKIDQNILIFEPIDVEDTVEEAEDLSEASVEENLEGEDIEIDQTNYELENDLDNEESLLGEGIEMNLTNYDIEDDLRNEESLLSEGCIRINVTNNAIGNDLKNKESLLPEGTEINLTNYNLEIDLKNEESLLGEGVEMNLTNNDIEENDLKNVESLLGEVTEVDLTNYDKENDLKNEEWNDDAMDDELEKRQIEAEQEKYPLTEEIKSNQMGNESEQSSNEYSEMDLKKDELENDFMDEDIEKQLAVDNYSMRKGSLIDFGDEDLENNLIEEKYLLDKHSVKDIDNDINDPIGEEIEEK